MKKVIRSIEKGWGEGSTFFTTDKNVSETFRVDEIKEGFKQTSIDGDGFPIYSGYKDGKLLFEIGASIHTTVIYVI